MLFSRSSTVPALALSLLPLALAQTSTSCNPTEKTCPQDTGLNNAAFTSDFTKGRSAFASWSAADGTTMNFGENGAEFTINAAGQAPTVQTDFYIFFGRVDVEMQAAPGTGIVSSIVFESDDLDEIDWEFLGGNTAQTETNFFGKGNTTSYDRAIYYPVSTPQSEFHTYTVDWNSDRIEWIIDGKTVRTLTRNDPLTIGGTQYPQTPMRVKLGNWCGGCAGEPSGTVQWAGGQTSFGDAPYVMYVKSVSIQNYNPATSYEYTDKSGSWQSIKVIKDGSTEPANPSGSASAAASNATVAPTKSLPVSAIMNSGAAVSHTIKGGKGGNFTMKPTGARGNIKTHTSIVTANPAGGSPTGSGAASATPNPGMQNSATALRIMSSTSLLGIFLSYLLL